MIYMVKKFTFYASDLLTEDKHIVRCTRGFVRYISTSVKDDWTRQEVLPSIMRSCDKNANQIGFINVPKYIDQVLKFHIISIYFDDFCNNCIHYQQ